MLLTFFFFKIAAAPSGSARCFALTSGSGAAFVNKQRLAAAPLLFWSKSGSGATFQVAVAPHWYGKVCWGVGVEVWGFEGR